MSQNFEPGQIVGQSWEVFKNNVGPLLGGFLVLGIILSVSSMVPFAPLVLTGPFLLGFYKMVQTAAQAHPVDFADIFSGFQKFLPAFLACVLITIFSSVGLIFCIVPGILISILYMPTFLFILNEDLAFWDAMEASRKMVMDNLGPWIVLALILAGLNLLGALVCGLGLLVTGPMSAIAIALAYDRNKGSLGNAVTPSV
jgi:uncharacterized membrane protein